MLLPLVKQERIVEGRSARLKLETKRSAHGVLLTQFVDCVVHNFVEKEEKTKTKIFGCGVMLHNSLVFTGMYLAVTGVLQCATGFNRVNIGVTSCNSV